MRMLTIYQAIFASLFFISCNEYKASVSKQAWIFTDSLTRSLDSFSKTSLIPGFAVAVVNEKGFLYSKGFGYADLRDSIPFTDSTVNWVASVSKTFVALSVMKLVEEGRLQLDEPINSILSFKVSNPVFPDIPITVRHLVNHSATIVDDAFVPYYIGEADIALEKDSKDYDSLPAYLQPNLKYYRMGKKISLAEHVENYLKRGAKWYTDSSFLAKKPGTYFLYSNLGAALAARIVEIKSGQSFIAFTQKNIFEPLSMKNTAWNFQDLKPALVSKIYAHNKEQNPTGVVEHPQYYMTNYPVSGLKTNAVDLGKYIIEMIRGIGGKGILLKPESYQQLFRAGSAIEGLNSTDRSDLNTNFSRAVFWSVSARGIRIHFGGNTGVYSFVYFDPSTNTGALAYANLRDNSFGDLLSIVNRYVLPPKK